jgi:transposase
MNTTPRQQRAIEIADRFRIVKSNEKWFVPSQSNAAKYAVVVDGTPRCTCPDYELRGGECKHILAVQIVVERERAVDGSVTVTETLKVTKRTTYPQNWPSYNLAQSVEKDHFQILLRDLCSGIVAERETGRGRPSLLLSDAIFAGAFKVYSTVSTRRFMSDLREAHERGLITRIPQFNTICHYLNKPELTPILRGLVEQSSLPLKSVEVDFAADSSGFSTSRFYRWFDHKYGKERLQHDWVKVHIMCGVKTNIVTAVEIRGREQADSPMLPPLLDTTKRHFAISEVSADKGYLSYNNAHHITKAGAVPFIAFKNNSGPGDGVQRGRGKVQAWSEMYHYFMFKRSEFLQHYHKRSNVESTFSMMKRKFGDSVRSKTDTGMVNEVLCKVLCHNLVVLIHEMFELGIEPIFCTESQDVQQIAQ